MASRESVRDLVKVAADKARHGAALLGEGRAEEALRILGEARQDAATIAGRLWPAAASEALAGRASFAQTQAETAGEWLALAADFARKGELDKAAQFAGDAAFWLDEVAARLSSAGGTDARTGGGPA